MNGFQVLPFHVQVHGELPTFVQVGMRFDIAIVVDRDSRGWPHPAQLSAYLIVMNDEQGCLEGPASPLERPNVPGSHEALEIQGLEGFVFRDICFVRPGTYRFVVGLYTIDGGRFDWGFFDLSDCTPGHQSASTVVLPMD
jgi:hypothetical protein